MQGTIKYEISSFMLYFNTLKCVWCIPPLLGALKDQISSSKLNFHKLQVVFWCMHALPGALQDEIYPFKLYFNTSYAGFWCILALQRAMRYDISSSKLSFDALYGMCWCIPALPVALNDEISFSKICFYEFTMCVLMQSCAAGNLERWDLIFQDLLLCVYKVRFDAFLRCQ